MVCIEWNEWTKQSETIVQNRVNETKIASNESNPNHIFYHILLYIFSLVASRKMKMIWTVTELQTITILKKENIGIYLFWGIFSPMCPSHTDECTS